MCTKRKYKNKLSAMIALASCLSVNKVYNNKKRMETRYYWCKECNAYHLTKQRKKNNQSMHSGTVFDSK